jgi:hypothetical protein
VTETESPWADPSQFTQMEALEVYEANLCRECGRPIDVCSDPDLPIMTDDRICMFTRAVRVAEHWYELEHVKEKRQRGRPFWSDGKVYIPRPMADDEIAQYDRELPSLVVGGTDS